LFSEEICRARPGSRLHFRRNVNDACNLAVPCRDLAVRAQALDGLQHQGLQACAAAIEMRQNGLAHARLPIFSQMVLDIGDGLHRRPMTEEAADLMAI